MQEALNSKGITLSEEEVASIRTLFDKVKSGEISREQLEEWSRLAENGELSEETLEKIAGGSFLASILLVIGVAVGAIIAISLTKAACNAMDGSRG